MGVERARFPCGSRALDLLSEGVADDDVGVVDRVVPLIGREGIIGELAGPVAWHEDFRGADVGVQGGAAPAGDRAEVEPEASEEECDGESECLAHGNLLRGMGGPCGRPPERPRP
jgi:hypothetical protein